MTARDHAATWHDALKRAGQLHPHTIARSILATSDSGLRAQRFDADGGGRTSNVECRDETCEDGPDAHSHPITSDPTGNAATRGRQKDPGATDLLRLDRATREFITAANGVLWWVTGETARTWEGVVRQNAKLMPGTVQAGLDVDDERRLPRIIDNVSRCVDEVARIAREHLPHAPSVDDQHWTAGLADEDVCLWHLDMHRRYRRPKVGAYQGERICADCMHLVLVLETKPPRWLIEAFEDLHEGQPKAWQKALSRCMDDLGVVRSA